MKKLCGVVLLVVVVAAHPAAARRSVAGRSVQGRSIALYQRGPRGAPVTVLVAGCIHGDECAGRAIVKRLRNVPEPQRIDLRLMPTLNPDGRKAGARQNARGVDLNRNFRRGWRRQSGPWSTYYSGPRPFSEPEARVARDLVTTIEPDITIWYHQAMAIVVKMKRHQKVQRHYARRVGLPLRALDPLPGTASRWQNHRFPQDISFVVELPEGPLARSAVRKHARAVLEIARLWR